MSGGLGLAIATGWAWAGTSDARAQGLRTSHPVVPAASIAGENGPATLWQNPANLSYDRDFRFAAMVSRGGLDAPTSAAITAGTGGFGFGVHNQLRPVGGGVVTDWSLDYGTSLALPKRLSLGLLLSWRLVAGGKNYVAYDAGLAWRPLPWLGIGGVAQNVGDPDPNGLALPKTGAGIALRPLGSLVVLGADYARLFGTDPNDASVNEDHVVASVRLRPLEGLYLRGAADANVTGDGLGQIALTGGVEVYLGGVGASWVGSNDLAGTGQTLTVGSDEPGESLIRSGRRVPTLAIDAPPPYQPRSGLLVADEETSWLDTLELLRRAEDDPGVRGLAVTLDGASLSLARCRELRERIQSLEAEDKPVLVYLTGNPTNGDYYVASAATRVALHPAADLQLTGLSVEMTQLRGLLDLVGVEPQFVKRADYKTSPEQWTEVEPTQANLEMTDALLDDLYGELVDAIGAGRGADADTVRRWIDGGPYAADEAKENGLVDVLLYPDQLDDELEKLHGGSVSMSDLLAMPQPRSAWEDPQQIAVVYIDGPITSGASSGGGLLSSRSVGSKNVIQQLYRARKDPQVRAVVIRVDSPGGSSFASDEIWRATQRLRQRGKPVVVSMGSVAASGGYYVAAGADAIWAEPTTITGSIGVYSGKFATDDAQHRLGVTTTVLSRGRNGAIQSTTRPWDDEQRARMQTLVDHTYAQFKQRVVDGRGLDADEVERIARGRVWSGLRAKELHLVDGLGGFQDAIDDARARAGIPSGRKVGIVTYSDSGDLLQSLAPSITASVARPLFAQIRGEAGRDPLADVADVADRWLHPLEPLLLPALHPEEQVWMLDPFSLQVGGQ